MLPMLLIIHTVNSKVDGTNCILFISDRLKMNEELAKERDQLLTNAEGLREKLNKATAIQQEVEAQRDTALENISQVNTFQILIDSRLTFTLLQTQGVSVAYDYALSCKKMIS